jgi:putative MATE family efflux protein
MNLLPVNSFYKNILKIALPAIAGLSTQMVVSLVDAAMVGRLDNAQFALAAMGLGVLATWAIISFFSSLATGTHVLVARRFGAKEFKSCGDVLFNSILIAFLIGIVITSIGVFFSSEIGNFFAKDAVVASLASDYIFFRLLGIPFFLISVSYRGFYFGIGNTKVFMVSGLLVNFLNIILNYIFIYGEFGAPRMELAGAGLGSSLATFSDVLFYFCVSLYPQFRKRFQLYRSVKIIPSILKSMYKISLPVAFQSVFILLGFLSFVAITGLLGIIEQAATQAIISTLFMSFLPCFGFGIAVQTLVGNNVGKGKITLAMIYGFETAKIATYYTLLLAVLYILFPNYLLLIITTDKSIIDTAIPAMRIAGFAQIFYATGVVLANGLQAIGKTTFVMIAEVISNLFIFVPLAYFLGIFMEFGLVGAWLALPIYIVIYSLLILLNYKYGEWKTGKNL